MNAPPPESISHRTERIARLKQRAQAALEHSTDPNAAPGTTLPDAVKLLEELRIYQVELELQNEELRAAQQEAELARRRYQTLFDQMPTPCLVLDTNGMIEDCNAMADQLLGERRRFVTMDRRLWRRLGSKDTVRLHHALRNVPTGSVLVLPEMLMAEREEDLTPVFDFHLIGLGQDYKLDRRVLLLLADRSAEMARTEDQRFYTRLLDASDSLIYATDRRGQFLLANQALLQFWGLNAQAVLGQRRQDFMAAHEALAQNESDQQVLQRGHALTLQEVVQAPRGGEAKHWVTRKFALHDRQGRVIGVGGLSTDVTELRAQQHELNLSETVFQRCEEAIIVTDASGRIVRVNPAFTRQSGFSADTVLGRKPRILQSGRQSDAFYAELWETLVRTGQWSGEFENRRADGVPYSVLCGITAVRDATARVQHYIAVQTDITRLHDAWQRLALQAGHDRLTGLPGRMLLEDRLSQQLALAQRSAQPLALVFLDLDGFKAVNDQWGHSVGDALLQAMAQRLKAAVRVGDTVARLGGDEFVLLLPQTDAAGAQALTQSLMSRVQAPLRLCDEYPYTPSASVGLVLFPDHGTDAQALLEHLHRHPTSAPAQVATENL
ncbi:MAG: hypothetical protein Fur007_06790 [Rhodoferax sp.]